MTFPEPMNDQLSIGVDALLDDGLRLSVLPTDMWGVIHWEMERDGGSESGAFTIPVDLREFFEAQPVEVAHPCPELSNRGYTKLIFVARGEDMLGTLRVRQGL